MVAGSGTGAEGPIGTILPLLSYSRPPLKPRPLLGAGQTFAIVLLSMVTTAVCAKALPFSIVAAWLVAYHVLCHRRRKGTFLRKNDQIL